LDTRILLAIFLRTFLVGAAFNTKGMQNVGLSFIMEPGLRALYGSDVAMLQRARGRYLKFYNTHPFWTPLLVGIFLSMENKIARGLLPPDILPKLRATTVYTLSGLGDSFFGGSLLVTWSLVCINLALSDRPLLLAIWVLFCFLVLQIFKIFTFARGYSQGLAFLQKLKSWNLIDWSQRLKMLNAALLALFYVRLQPGDPVWTLLAVSCAALLAAVSTLRIRDRGLVIVILLLLSLLTPWDRMTAAVLNLLGGI